MGRSLHTTAGGHPHLPPAVAPILCQPSPAMPQSSQSQSPTPVNGSPQSTAWRRRNGRGASGVMPPVTRSHLLPLSASYHHHFREGDDQQENKESSCPSLAVL